MIFFQPDIYSHHFYKKFLTQENLYFLFAQSIENVYLDPDYQRFEDLKFLTILRYCKRSEEGIPVVLDVKGKEFISQYVIPSEVRSFYNMEMAVLKKVYLVSLVRQMDILLSNLN